MELVFEIYPKNMEALMKEKIDEKEIWMVIGDLLSYLTDLKNLGLNNGDLQPEYIYKTNNNSIKVLNPLLFTEYQSAYKYRLANDNYKSTFAPELLS